MGNWSKPWTKLIPLLIRPFQGRLFPAYHSGGVAPGYFIVPLRGTAVGPRTIMPSPRSGGPWVGVGASPWSVVPETAPNAARSCQNNSALSGPKVKIRPPMSNGGRPFPALALLPESRKRDRMLRQTQMRMQFVRSGSTEGHGQARSVFRKHPRDCVAVNLD